MIKLTVARTREKTEEEIAEEKKKYPYSAMDPLNYRVYESTLEVEITEEQFNAIRKEVLKNF